MTAWKPETYLSFAKERARPALDLIHQIPDLPFMRAVDLGCGPGTVTDLLKRRFQSCEIVGIDSSPDMLAKAKQLNSEITWLVQSIEDWHPKYPLDLIFSNAALHWVSDHHRLFPRLLAALNPGGILAVQMPDNFAEPTHQVLRDCLDNPIWNNQYDHLKPGFPVHQPAFYYDLLQDFCETLEIWQTTYLHDLDGDHAVAHWTKGSVLGVALSAIEDDDHRDMIEANYRLRLSKKYPTSKNGKTLLAFKRLFILAKKQNGS